MYDNLDNLYALAHEFALKQICPRSLLPATVWEHNTVRRQTEYGGLLLRLAIERNLLKRATDDTPTYTIEKMDIREWFDSLPDPEDGTPENDDD